MLIDSDSYIDQRTNWNLEQLYKEKQKLEKYISDYKKGKKQNIKDGYTTNPSPQVISDMYKKYLIKLNDLIAKKEREKKEERKYIELTDYNEINNFLLQNDFLNEAEICRILKKDGNAEIFFEYGNQEVEFYLLEVTDFTLDYYTYENYIDSISIKNHNGLINLEIDDNVISISAKSIKLRALDIKNTIYTYVSVKYKEDQEKTFYYISNIDNLKIGDYVWVSVRDTYCPGIVEKIEKFSYSNVPFPIYITKRIIRKSSKEEFEEFNNKEKNTFYEDYDYDFEKSTIKEQAKKLSFMKNNKLIECPCCGSKEVPAGEDGLYYICTKCGWENDEIQRDNPDYEGGANEMSLNEARKAFKEGRKVK